MIVLFRIVSRSQTLALGVVGESLATRDHISHARTITFEAVNGRVWYAFIV